MELQNCKLKISDRNDDDLLNSLSVGEKSYSEVLKESGDIVVSYVVPKIKNEFKQFKKNGDYYETKIVNVGSISSCEVNFHVNPTKAIELEELNIICTK